MDAVDREILSILREDARAPYRSLGAAVGLSANAAADRVRRLVKQGVIQGFVALVDETAAGAAGGSAGSERRLDLLVDVRLRSETDPTAFETRLMQLPSVVEAVHVTGVWDYQLRVRVPDPAHIDELSRLLKREAGAEQTQTRLVLRSVKRR
ncbi:MAG TPA: Lrp/AsnC family transcriptional regulator [Actinomycetales bacterium]|nr:Lrp/AsnC family transcriptional regulator [Actinomycetales bacterium]